MITTVTTTMVSTVTTLALTGSLALVSVLVLLALLVQREISNASAGHRVQKMNRVLDIAIAPLTIVFALTLIAKITETLR